jgi:hypothetical protein
MGLSSDTVTAEGVSVEAKLTRPPCTGSNCECPLEAQTQGAKLCVGGLPLTLNVPIRNLDNLEFTQEVYFISWLDIRTASFDAGKTHPCTQRDVDRPNGLG